MNTQNKEDQSLIDKFGQTGDQIWLARLFQKYDHLIYGVCLKYTADTEWSKDLKSQIYEKLMLKVKNLEVASFKSWLYTFCKNLCLDELRKKKRKIFALEKFRKFQIDSNEGVYFSYEERLILEEDEQITEKIMSQAAETLSKQQRYCIELFYFNRLSYIEISQKTGMDTGQIKSHLQNGKRKMRIFVHKQFKQQI